LKDEYRVVAALHGLKAIEPVDEHVDAPGDVGSQRSGSEVGHVQADGSPDLGDLVGIRGEHRTREASGSAHRIGGVGEQRPARQGWMFFLGIPLEPSRAGMMPRIRRAIT
jgi:hypothetical protein